MIGPNARLPYISGNLSLAFESLIDKPEGAHHFRRVSLICLKVFRFCVYEHLSQRMSTLGGEIRRAATDTAPTASKVLIPPPKVLIY
jgi:hypothetical protein